MARGERLDLADDVGEPEGVILRRRGELVLAHEAEREPGKFLALSEILLVMHRARERLEVTEILNALDSPPFAKARLTHPPAAAGCAA